jgi:predicted ATPase
VAAGLQGEVEAVEETCDELVRRGYFLTAQGSERWPDGTVSERYSFRHALYREVLSEQVAETRQLRLHRRIGERKEAAYGERVGEIAAELAVHFERGQDRSRAVRYREQAGNNAWRRQGYHEAIEHLQGGLTLLQTLPDTPERAEQELSFLIALGGPLITTKGYAAPEVEQAYARARTLCSRIGETPQLSAVLLGLWRFYLVRGDLPTANST